ncbi:MAG TPA: mobile mystery protein B [Gaiellaceae bacterium]
MNHLAGTHDGQTPVAPEELDGLIPSWISRQRDLDLAEQDNITSAISRLARRPPTVDAVLTERFLRRLHGLMFGDVWRWAGRYRDSDKNLGVPKGRIREDLAKLLADVRFWIEHETYEADEIAARFHHELVWIHPFPNGNGRFSRLAADLLVEALGRPRFTWREASGHASDDLRAEYIDALKALDGDPTDASAITAFARG